MLAIFLIAGLLIVGFLFAMLYVVEAYIAGELEKQKELTEFSYSLNEKLIYIRQVRKVVFLLLATIVGGFLIYQLIKDTPMQGFVMEWLNLLVRWTHVLAGIMWIGASFYFIFLENNLNRTDGIRDELAGNLWAIHGGGFYFLEKYKVAPKQLPKELHWFKYEAYFTWLSGFALLTIVYYMDAKSFLIDSRVADISTPAAIIIGIATLVVAWLIYDGLCKSPLVKNQLWFSIVGIVLLGGIAFFLGHVFSSRGAYIHVGALIGTLMAGNVYYVIIPSQKALVKAAELGKPLDASLGKKAGERSLHNNYFTLPVIFIMISNHFPSTYGHEYHWAILMVIALASAGIKHYWNLLERGQNTKLILPVSVIALLSLALVTSPAFEKVDENAAVVSFPEVNEIIMSRCIQCHSVAPTDEQWNQAPNKVMFDMPNQVQAMAERIMIRAVRTKSMPLGNKTNMTDEEREKIKSWILQGAKIE